MILAWFLLAVVAAPAVVCAEGEPAAFRQRRAELLKAAPGAVVALFGRKDFDDPHSPFRQEEDFYYLTGWLEPGAALLAAPGRDVLFLPGAQTPRANAYTGRMTGPGRR